MRRRREGNCGQDVICERRKKVKNKTKQQTSQPNTYRMIPFLFTYAGCRHLILFCSYNRSRTGDTKDGSRSSGRESIQALVTAICTSFIKFHSTLKRITDRC